MGKFSPILGVALFVFWETATALFAGQTEEPRLRARDLFLAGASETAATRPETGSLPDPNKTRKPAPVPLGLRCRITKLFPNGMFMDVNPDAVFRSGDRIRLIVEANHTGHLYIVLRGSSGRWSLLFPSTDLGGGDNLVTKGNRYEIPFGQASFQFDQNPGAENLFLVLTRQPEPDMEKLMQTLRQESAESKTAGNTPGAESSKPKAGLDDAAVEKIRRSVPEGDLLVEKVNEETSGAKPDKAIYAVNASTQSPSKVVVDVTLTHR